MRKLRTTELQRKSAEEMKTAVRLPAVVVLDNVRSAYNVGSVYRTCDAFAAEKIFLCGITAAPPNRELMKTALGSTESVPWEYRKSVYDAVLELKVSGYTIGLVEQTDKSISLEKFRPDANQKYALVFGNEVEGVSESLLPIADLAIEIPQFGAKHSFNISVSAGIVLWELYKKLRS
ncbi:MAG: TrmH family RNA methyltransferase [Bacteroidetes bacterium]|nr:TrmH family RNA methyltransferase [Bacteroidota bacterium]